MDLVNKGRSEDPLAQCAAVAGLSHRLVRHGPRHASQLSGTYLPDDFSYDAWRGPFLTGRWDTCRQNRYGTIYAAGPRFCKGKVV